VVDVEMNGQQKTVVVLGAGAMGSAFTTPLTRNGHRVRLWGTWLDDDLLAEIRAHRPHPRTGVVVDARVDLFPSARLAAALDGADLVVLAITSTGVADIYARAVRHCAPGVPVLIASKGFGRDTGGRVLLIPDLLDRVTPGRHPFVAIAGPCKANEVGEGRPSVAVFATPDVRLGRHCAHMFATDMYTVIVLADIAGVEIAAATKNAYAIVLGICDGLGTAGGQPWHNLKAALFSQAVAEMGVLAAAVGGRVDTVYGFPGVGDLEVTGLSGRNRALGERIGWGQPSTDAIAAMEGSGQTVEGPAAARLAWTLARNLEEQGHLSLARVPVLAGLIRMLDADVPPLPLLGHLLPSLAQADVLEIER